MGVGECGGEKCGEGGSGIGNCNNMCHIAKNVLF